MTCFTQRYIWHHLLSMQSRRTLFLVTTRDVLMKTVQRIVCLLLEKKNVLELAFECKAGIVLVV